MYRDPLWYFNKDEATEKYVGEVKLATKVEVVAGTNDEKAVTPEGLQASLDSVIASPGAIGGTTPAAGTFTTLTATDVNISGKSVYTPDAITATSAGVAASVATVVTEITTNGDSDLDNVTLANGIDGQVKIFAVVAVGNVADSVKITPASMIGGTQITFAANPLGLGCQMVYDAGAAGWIVTGNNAGTVA